MGGEIADLAIGIDQAGLLRAGIAITNELHGRVILQGVEKRAIMPSQVLRSKAPNRRFLDIVRDAG